MGGSAEFGTECSKSLPWTDERGRTEPTKILHKHPRKIWNLVSPGGIAYSKMKDERQKQKEERNSGACNLQDYRGKKSDRARPKSHYTRSSGREDIFSGHILDRPKEARLYSRSEVGACPLALQAHSPEEMSGKARKRKQAYHT